MLWGMRLHAHSSTSNSRFSYLSVEHRALTALVAKDSLIGYN